MRDLTEFRFGKPGFYPDQSVYAEFACAAFGLRFQDIDGGSGLLFSVSSNDKSLHFGKAQTEADVKLPPGDHTLTLQFGDGAHQSFGPEMSQTIKIHVK